MGLPNCSRVRLYSSVIACSASIAPTDFGGRRRDARLDHALDQRQALADLAQHRVWPTRTPDSDTSAARCSSRIV